MRMKSAIVNLNQDDTLLKKIIDVMASKRHAIEKGVIELPVFYDGETSPHFLTSVRGKRIYILSSPDTPLKREQLILAIDAARRASACEIIPIIPYFPYARQDKKDQYRGPIGAKVMAETLQERGASSIITFDLHADQIVGFFNIPVIHLKGKYLFYKCVLELSSPKMILCSPDAGGLKRVKKFRDLIYERHNEVKLPIMSLDKSRPNPNEVGEIEVLGNVQGKDVLIIDDMCDTGGTLIKGCDALLKAGALSVRVLVTHGVLSEGAGTKIANSSIKEFICSDSLVDYKHVYNMDGKKRIISTAGEIANAIVSINSDDSIYKQIIFN